MWGFLKLLKIIQKNFFGGEKLYKYWGWDFGKKVKWNNIIISLLKDITTNLINYEAQVSIPAEQEAVGTTKNDTTDNPNEVTRRTQSDDSDDNN